MILFYKVSFTGEMERQRAGQRSSIHWLTLQVVSRSAPGLIRSWDQIASFHMDVEPRALVHSLLSSQTISRELDQKQSNWDLSWSAYWVTGAAVRALACCATMPAQIPSFSFLVYPIYFSLIFIFFNSSNFGLGLLLFSWVLELCHWVV